MTLEMTETALGNAGVRLSVSGDINIHTAMQLRKQLKTLLDPKHEEVRVDLSGVDFMDSAGIATLVEGLQWSQDSGGRFTLSGLTDNVRDIFTLAKLDTVFDIREDHASDA
ncbi:MAG TPA: STAS domain-containing protein [Mariprofundaceae bacterium]|nr:STAS domain-containing protein [Mariprofundaceae bacterium]